MVLITVTLVIIKQFTCAAILTPTMQLWNLAIFSNKTIFCLFLPLSWPHFPVINPLFSSPISAVGFGGPLITKLSVGGDGAHFEFEFFYSLNSNCPVMPARPFHFCHQQLSAWFSIASVIKTPQTVLLHFFAFRASLYPSHTARLVLNSYPSDPPNYTVALRPPGTGTILDCAVRLRMLTFFAAGLPRMRV